MYEDALVLVGFMWSLSVLIQLFSLWSDWLSSSAIFSENDEDTLQEWKRNKTKQRKQKLDKMKSEKRK